MREAMATIPGVIDVAFGQPVPGLQTGNFTTQVPDPRDPTKSIRLQTGNLDSRFIDLLGLRLAHGRAPTVLQPVGEGHCGFAPEQIRQAFQTLTGEIHGEPSGSEKVSGTTLD